MSWKTRLTGSNRAVFLDRDGTIHPDTGYLHHPDEVAIYPAARRGMKLLADRDFLLFLVTNQSGVGRGYFPAGAVERVHEKIVAELAADGIGLAGIAYCPHRPDEGCRCRKPAPGMILDLAARHGVDLARSYMVGDQPTDIEAGRRAGCRTVLLAGTRELSGWRRQEGWRDPDWVAGDLLEAAFWITRAAPEEAEKNETNR